MYFAINIHRKIMCVRKIKKNINNSLKQIYGAPCIFCHLIYSDIIQYLLASEIKCTQKIYENTRFVYTRNNRKYFYAYAYDTNFSFLSLTTFAANYFKSLILKHNKK